MDLLTVLIIVLLGFSFWFLLSKRMDNIESDLEALGKAIGKEDFLTKIQHRDQS